MAWGRAGIVLSVFANVGRPGLKGNTIPGLAENSHAHLHASALLTTNVLWPELSSFRCLPFLAVMDCVLELWTLVDPFSLGCFSLVCLITSIKNEAKPVHQPNSASFYIYFYIRSKPFLYFRRAFPSKKNRSIANKLSPSHPPIVVILFWGQRTRNMNTEYNGLVTDGV